MKSELWLLVVALTSFREGCRICLEHYFASIGIVRMHEFPVNQTSSHVDPSQRPESVMLRRRKLAKR
jgi:hypothetical protein